MSPEQKALLIWSLQTSISLLKRELDDGTLNDEDSKQALDQIAQMNELIKELK